AEDGIRDKLVTGVQTCALPISGALGGPPARAGGRGVAVPHRDRVPLGAGLRGNGAGVFVHAALANPSRRGAAHARGAPVDVDLRSEERRVGREGITRVATTSQR